MFGFPSRILRRLSVAHKLLLIFALDMPAVAYISGIVMHEKFLAIDFARKERVAIACIEQLQPTLLFGTRSIVNVQGGTPAALHAS